MSQAIFARLDAPRDPTGRSRHASVTVELHRRAIQPE